MRLSPARSASAIHTVKRAFDKIRGESSAPTAAQSSTPSDGRVYDVNIYCGEPLPTLTPAEDKTRAAATCRSLPLVATEQVRVRWTRYQEYLAMFADGEKGIEHMKSVLTQTLSPELASLLRSPPTDRPMRIWWSCETPELEDMPWELIAHGNGAPPGERVLLVRGMPPDEPPLLMPTPPKLRVGITVGASADSMAIRDLAGPGTLGEAVEVIRLDGPPREALRQAAAEACHVLHLVCDAFTSISYEGFLYQPGASAPELTAREVGEALRGSGVLLLCLTPPDCNHDMTTIGGLQAPSAFRGYAYFSSSRGLAQSVIAPLGPISPGLQFQFWREFYRQLGESLVLADAVAAGMTGKPVLPLALFLRHPWHRLFLKETLASPALQGPPPQQIQAQIALSANTLDQLRATADRFGEQMPSGIKELFDQESNRHQRLQSQLDVWNKSLGSEDAR